MNDEQRTDAAPTAAQDPTAPGHRADDGQGFSGLASFAGAESREILDLLGEGSSGAGCCGGSCCSA